MTLPPDLCECGCGEPAPIATYTHRPRGWVKGQPKRFISGHNSQGHLPEQSPLEERFWSRVEKTSRCWNWTGSTGNGGYGHIRVDGRTRKATHVSLALIGVEVPKGMHVCHHCDNPACVRPSHLFIGDAFDNMSDASRKGRFPSREGKLNQAAKLTEDEVREIRR